jgi:REP element-mobilizing transposase RayT
VQLGFSFRTWGGRRKGAGRKPRGVKAGVSHQRRPVLKACQPVHVTLKLKNGLPNLRHKPLARLVSVAFQASKERFGVRLNHFSIQSNHVHLIVEVDGHRALSRAMQSLTIRLARRLNQRVRRRGPVFADRYHARPLRTPLEVRRALVYVLHNHRHHHTGPGRKNDFDPMSSAAYFDGFAAGLFRLARRALDPSPDPPVVAPRTWLLRLGWRRHGLLNDRDAPSNAL